MRFYFYQKEMYLTKKGENMNQIIEQYMQQDGNDGDEMKIDCLIAH